MKLASLFLIRMIADPADPSRMRDRYESTAGYATELDSPSPGWVTITCAQGAAVIDRSNVLHGVPYVVPVVPAAAKKGKAK